MGIQLTENLRVIQEIPGGLVFLRKLRNAAGRRLGDGPHIAGQVDIHQCGGKKCISCSPRFLRSGEEVCQELQFQAGNDFPQRCLCSACFIVGNNRPVSADIKTVDFSSEREGIPFFCGEADKKVLFQCFCIKGRTAAPFPEGHQCIPEGFIQLPLRIAGGSVGMENAVLHPGRQIPGNF